MSKRLITVILVIALMMVGALAVNAADAANGTPREIAASVEVTPVNGDSIGDLCIVNPGETVDVSVTITKNTGFVVGSFTIKYDPTLVTPVCDEEGKLVAEVGSAFADYITTVVLDETVGEIKITILSSYDIQFYKDITAVDVELIALSFTVAEGAECQDSAIDVVRLNNNFMDSKYNTNFATEANAGEFIVHQLGEPTTTPATCTEPDVTVYACAACEEKVEVIGKALGHDNETVVTEPTCTEQGYTTYTCKVCNYSEVKDYVDANGHSYESVVTEPTCTEKGYTTYTCACGDTYVDNYVDAKGHTYESVVTEPTCTTEGYTTYTCACGDTYFNNKVDAKGHTYESVVTAPTCTEKGYTTYTCAVCEDSYVADYVDANGHSYETVVTAPTCTEKGYTTYTCAVCEDSYVADYVDANGHNYETVVTAPTCTEKGYTTYTCACGDTYVADYVDAKGHSYQSVVTAPTCTKVGYTTYTCACGNTYTDNYVEALGHKAEDIPAVEPTYKTKGATKGSKCSVCGEILVAPEEINVKSSAWIWITVSVSVVVIAAVVALVILKKKRVWIFAEK